jgi:hypothetical protein
MLPVFYVLATGAQLMLVSDRMPQLNYEPSCRAAMYATTGTNSTRTEGACLSDEKAAKAKLGQEWRQFSASQKGHCIRLLNAGGSPSYVELLTCVEMGKAVKRLDSRRNAKTKTAPAETTGRAPAESGSSGRPK